MKKIVIFICFFPFLTLNSQNVIKKSEDIVSILGRKYYIHLVDTLQTLYSIAKVYNVPLDQIVLINKEKVTQLKKGDILRIPVIDENYVPEPITKIEIVYHIVKKNESLFSIAQQYGVTQDDIIKYNPQLLDRGLEPKTTLKIPRKITPQIEVSDVFFIYYILGKNEDLPSISKKFNVPVEVLLEFNKGFIGEGAIVAIPKQKLTKEQIYVLNYNRLFENDYLNIDPNFFEDPRCEPCYRFEYKGQTFNIGILLPLFLDENLDAFQQSNRAISSSSIFYEFLQGALLALKDFEKFNVSLSVKIIDLKNNEIGLNDAILSKVQNCDLLIGPVYSYSYSFIKNFVIQNRINVVSPFSNKFININDNPFVFQMNSSFQTNLKVFAKYIFANATDSTNVLLVFDENPEILQAKDTFIYYIKQLKPDLKLNYIPFSKKIETYNTYLTSEYHNIVVLATTNPIQVTTLLNFVSVISSVNEKKSEVFLTTSLDNIQNFEVDWLNNIDVYYLTYLNVDNSEFAKLFNEAYINNYKQKPSNYSYLGYDLTYYFLNNLLQYGRFFQFCLGNNAEFNQGYFYNFDFRRLGQYTGFENQAFNLMKVMQNYETTIINISELMNK